MNQEDRRDVIRYKLADPEHWNHHGWGQYSSVVHHEHEGIGIGHGNDETQEYFYRAMSLVELDSYRNQFAFTKRPGHQGWAPYRQYSLRYLHQESSPLIKSSPLINRVVEAHLPGFIRRLHDEGWFIGKVERGCISWGIGLTQSNGWRCHNNLRARNKNEAVDPWDIFHERLRSVRVVTVLATR